MILSKSINEKTPSWLRGLAIASAIAILPMGLATADDDNSYAAVAKRLAKSVKKGHITEAQAYRMMAVLKHPSSEKDSHEHEHGQVEHNEERREIRGEKEADAEGKWEDLSKKIGDTVIRHPRFPTATPSPSTKRQRAAAGHII